MSRTVITTIIPPSNSLISRNEIAQNMSDDHGPSAPKVVLEFLGHALAGAAIFIIVALIAFGLGKFVSYLESWGAAPTLITILTALEYTILTGDVVLVALFLLTAVKKALKELLE